MSKREVVLEKKLILSKAHEACKVKFKGIDDVIDSIFKKIEVWYLYGELLYEPTIICLWGPTSVGKTDLVLYISRMLDMYQKYIYVDLSSPFGNKDSNDRGRFGDSVMNSRSIAGRLYSKIKKPSEKCILLVDEIQKIGGVGDPSENRNALYSDLWGILSDGKTGDGQSFLNKFDSTHKDLETEYNRLSQSASDSKAQQELSDNQKLSNDLNQLMAQMAINTGNAQVQQPNNNFNPNPMMGMGTPQNNTYTPPKQSVFQPNLNKKHHSFYRHPDECAMSNVAKYYMNTVCETCNFDSLDDLDPIFDWHNFGSVENSEFVGSKEKFRKLIDAGKMTLDEVYHTPNFAFLKPSMRIIKNKRKTLADSLSAPTGHDPLVFSNLLIFVAGNVDSLYTGHNESDPDKLNQITSSITRPQLDEALLKLFREEEVGRFGKNHVIYPTLNKEAFLCIIKNKLKLVEDDTFESHGIKLNLRTKEFIRFIYKNGIDAPKGARPTHSAIYSYVSYILPRYIDMIYDIADGDCSNVELNDVVTFRKNGEIEIK